MTVVSPRSSRRPARRRPRTRPCPTSLRAASTLCATPDIETQVKNDQGQGEGIVTINSGESVTDTVVVSGSKGVAEGTVDFFVCGPTNSPQDCNNGTRRGNDIALVGGEAESSVFTPTAKPTTAQPDYYCFRVEYTPAAGSKYLADEHTNNTTECVKVIPADVRVIKTPNAGTVNAGESINFTLQWGNVGEGKATGVVVTDSLPGTSGLNWCIDGSTGTGSTCSIAGAVGSQVLTCNVVSINGNTPAIPADVDDNTLNSGSVTVRSGDDAGLLRRHRQHRTDHVDERRDQREPRPGHRPVPGRQRREDAEQRSGQRE